MIKSFFRALFNSLSGLRYVVFERAVVWELLIFIPTNIYLFLFVDALFIEKILFLFATFIVFITEFLNTAIEAVVDKASPEYSLLAKQSKDVASAAVFLSLVFSFIIFLYVIF